MQKYHFHTFIRLIQVPELKTKILGTMAIFLGLPHVHVRKTTATKLYEALILHADVCEIPENDLDEVSPTKCIGHANNITSRKWIFLRFFQIMNILSETDWGQSITEIRVIRNQLCTLLGISPPVTIAK